VFYSLCANTIDVSLALFRLSALALGLLLDFDFSFGFAVALAALVAALITPAVTGAPYRECYKSVIQVSYECCKSDIRVI
jgi:hypothetical protein